MRASSTVPATVVLVALLAACGGAPDSPAATDPTAGAGASSDTPSGTPSGPPTGEGPEGPTGAGPRTATNTPPWDLVVTDARVGRHDGYDRLVLEFSGTGAPGWAARYVDEAVQEGSGEVLPIEGQSILQVDVSGTTFEGAGAARPPQVEPLGDLLDVHVGGAFEGYSQVFIGIAGDRTPFEVSALTSPTRLVIDVATTG